MFISPLLTKIIQNKSAKPKKNTNFTFVFIALLNFVYGVNCADMNTVQNVQ